MTRIISHPFQLAAEDLKKNPEQWEVFKNTGNCVVLAGPGSGKTKTLTVKLASLAYDKLSVRRSFACITYSSECAREISNRLRALGVKATKEIFIGTVHSFCLTQIIQPFAHLADVDIPLPPKIISHAEQKQLLQMILKEAGHDLIYIDDWKVQIENYRKRYPDHTVADWTRENPELAELAEKYEKAMHERGLMDFDAMVIFGLRLLKECDWIRDCIIAKYSMLAVDEYQDLGLGLHLIVLLLQRSGIRLMAVGDPDQSLYRFNEARPELLLELTNDPNIKTVRLRFNYRNGKNILAASLAALAEHRDYESKNEHDGIIYFNNCPGGIGEQANFACAQIHKFLQVGIAREAGSVAVIYRNKFDGDIISGACEANSIKHIRFDANADYSKVPLTRFLEDCAVWCFSDLLASRVVALDLVATWLAFNRSLDKRGRRTAERALLDFLFRWRNQHAEPLIKFLEDFHHELVLPFLADESSMLDQLDIFTELMKACRSEPLSKFSVARFSGQADAPDHVRLLTYHSAKGLEFDAVILIGLDEGSMPHYKCKTGTAIRDERQAFYVGLTRARNTVQLLYSGFTETKGGYRHYNGRSRFVNEVELRLQRQTTE